MVPGFVEMSCGLRTVYSAMREYFGLSSQFRPVQPTIELEVQSYQSYVNSFRGSDCASITYAVILTKQIRFH